MRETVKTIAALALMAVVFSLGCHISDYPIITDDRGEYSGVIRTGHKAYIDPTMTVATIWGDGTDETFTTVYQNQYGDQTLYTFNNYDPTGTVTWLDQTYCDWQLAGDCAAASSWNPVQNDDPFDLLPGSYNPDCSGSRSLCLWVSISVRNRECGDGLLRSDPQAFFEELSLLEETEWRGERAYLLPLDSHQADVTLVSADGSRWSAPIHGRTNALMTDRMQVALPMTPNTRHMIRWAKQWAAEHGERATAELRYGGVSAEIELGLRSEGLSYNAGRY